MVNKLTLFLLLSFLSNYLFAECQGYTNSYTIYAPDYVCVPNPGYVAVCVSTSGFRCYQYTTNPCTNGGSPLNDGSCSEPEPEPSDTDPDGDPDGDGLPNSEDLDDDGDGIPDDQDDYPQSTPYATPCEGQECYNFPLKEGDNFVDENGNIHEVDSSPTCSTSGTCVFESHDTGKNINEVPPEEAPAPFDPEKPVTEKEHGQVVEEVDISETNTYDPTTGQTTNTTNTYTFITDGTKQYTETTTTTDTDGTSTKTTTTTSKKGGTTTTTTTQETFDETGTSTGTTVTGETTEETGFEEGEDSTGKVSGGIDCSAPPVMSGGDPILMEQVRQQWYTRCGTAVSGGLTCDNPPICSGSQYQCAMVMQQFLTRCPSVEEGSLSEYDLGIDEELTFSNSLNNFKTAIQAAPILTAIDGFFTFNGSNTCPVWSANVPPFGTIVINHFCSGVIPWGVISGVLIAVCTLLAARIAFT